VALLRTPGVRRAFRESATFEGLTNSDVEVCGPVDVEVVVEAVGSDVVVSGRLSAPWRGSCRRCVGEVTGSVELDVREIFELDPTEGETYPRGREEIDLDPMVREAVLLGLPLAPLCRDDCVGPDPQRYPARTASDEGPRPDPRWAALDALRPDVSEASDH
jgi:uncharacterized protein